MLTQLSRSSTQIQQQHHLPAARLIGLQAQRLYAQAGDRESDAEPPQVWPQFCMTYIRLQPERL